MLVKILAGMVVQLWHVTACKLSRQYKAAGSPMDVRTCQQVLMLAAGHLLP
jgi:hypothetical protein